MEISTRDGRGSGTIGSQKEGHQTVSRAGERARQAVGLRFADLVSQDFRVHFLVPARGLSMYTNYYICIQRCQGL